MVSDGCEGASLVALVLKQSSDRVDRAQVGIVDTSEIRMSEPHLLASQRELRRELLLLVFELCPADEKVQNADDRPQHTRDQGDPNRSGHCRIMVPLNGSTAVR
jgi:hypothetical protein